MTGSLFRVAIVAVLLAAVAPPVASQASQAARDDAPLCTAARARAAAPVGSWTRWGGDVRNTRSSSRTGVTAPAGRDSLALRWSLRVGDVANVRGQPAVAAGRMYVASESGNLWALDLSTGCQWWRVSVGVPIRTSVVAALDTRGRASTLYVGDGTGQVRAFDATSGKERWAARVDAHPTAIVTGAPQLHAGVLYVGVSSYESAMPLQPKYTCCTFRGSVVALDAATGRRLWQTYTVDEDPRVSGTSPSGAEVRGPSGAAVWSTPTIDERLGRLYVGTGNNYSAPQSARSDAIIAMDLKTGSVVWSKQFTANDGYNVSCDMPGKYNCPSSDGPDADIGQPPMLVTLSGGGRALLVGAKSGVLRSLDPDREGAVRWEFTVGPGGKLGGLHWGSATDGRRVFAAYGGQQIDPVADSTVPGGVRLLANPKVGGGLVAVDVQTGRLVWRAPAPVCPTKAGCSPAQSAAVTVADGIVWSGALDGHVRGYDIGTGRVLWDEDTARPYSAVNGAAHGGSMDVAGPVVAGSTLIVGSGYALYGAMPGNVLLVYARVVRR